MLQASGWLSSALKRELFTHSLNSGKWRRTTPSTCLRETHHTLHGAETSIGEFPGAVGPAGLQRPYRFDPPRPTPRKAPPSPKARSLPSTHPEGG
jgi:hypothetical protein